MKEKSFLFSNGPGKWITAYKDGVCANGWYDPMKAHQYKTGDQIYGVEERKKDGTPKYNLYCGYCANERFLDDNGNPKLYIGL